MVTARPAGGDGEHADVLASSLTSADHRLLYLCVFILPFRDLTFPYRKGWEVSVTAHMVKEAIKSPLRDAQAVSKILSRVNEMATILSKFRSRLAAKDNAQSTREGGWPRELTPPCRLRVGLLLHSLKEQ